MKNCCYVAVCWAPRGASAPTREERGGAYRGGRPPAYSLLEHFLKNRSTFCLVAEVKGKAAWQFRAVFTAYIAFAFVLWVCRFRGVISMAMNKIFNDCKSIEFPQRLV